MLQEGIVDRNIKFTPVLDGYRMPEYIDWELQPFSNHKVGCSVTPQHAFVVCFLHAFVLVDYTFSNHKVGYSVTPQHAFET
jgi:hypothetical protein